MTITVLDFETYDPLLKRYDSGAVFKYHYPEVTFDVLGCGVKISDSDVWTDNTEFYINFKSNKDALLKLNEVLKITDILVMHNSLYDLGCIKYLYKDTNHIEKFLPEIHDTMLIAKLIDQHKYKYSLDSLCQEYNCINKKASNKLHDWAWESGLYGIEKEKITGRKTHTRPSDNLLEQFCKANMHLMDDLIVEDYCMQDIRATWDLYYALMPLLYTYSLSSLSDIIKICLKTKFKGCRIDLEKVEELKLHWKNTEITNKKEIEKELNIENTDININSNNQLGPILEAKGIKIPKTEKGNYSIKNEWLEEQGNPLLSKLRLYKKCAKAESMFISKIFSYQEAIPEKYRNSKYATLFPSLHPLGATKTGRFTSGGGTGNLQLNFLAVSGRDKEFGHPLRNIFVARVPDEKLVCADFSNQEPRLQLHYATLLSCSGTKELVDEWKINPTMKYHQKVAYLTKLEYATAKTITLGLSYGMGAGKLGISLELSFQKAKELINQYYRWLPFLKQLQDITSMSIKKNGYIKTIGGRKLNIDPPYYDVGKVKSYEYRGLSKLIQGSALDQLWQSMINIDKAGLDFYLCVHDEILICTNNTDRDKILLKECMESAYKLNVPVIADVGIGDTWLEAKPK